MTRALLLSALGTLVALLGAWLVWRAAPALIATLGLGRFELLARVLLVFAALGLAERIITYVAIRYSPSPSGSSKELSNDH